MSKSALMHLVSLWLLLVLGMAFLSSCSDDDPEEVLCDGVCLEQKLAIAYNSLEAKLFEYNESGADDPERPSDIDFRVPLADYEDVYNADSSNLEGRFGLSVCRLLVLAMDPEINAAFDEWEAYLDDNTPFEVDATGGGKALGIPVGMPSSDNTLKLPYELINNMVLANLTLTQIGAEPQITRTQDILLNQVLPQVQEALALLAPVASNAEFTFVLSGRMQGNATSADEEIDQTDILALKASYELLAAACHIAVAYDLQLTSYDDAGILAGFDQETGNISALRPGGASHLAAVPELFLAAINDVDAAITSLLNEDDDQENDIIKLGPDGIDEADAIDVQDNYLDDARAVFQGPLEYSEDWDSNSETPDIALTIDLHEFFNNPVTDWKKQAPPYEVTTTTRDYSGYIENEEEGVLADVHFELDQPTYSMSYSVSFYDYEVDYISIWNCPEGMIVAAEALLDEKLAFLQGLENSAGRGYLNVWHNGHLDGGAHIVDLGWEFYYTTAETFVYVPILTWDADTYQDWQDQWPDATLGGLLPEISSIEELCGIFAFSEGDWEKSTIFDWANGDFGSVDDPLPPQPGF